MSASCFRLAARRYTGRVNPAISSPEIHITLVASVTRSGSITATPVGHHVPARPNVRQPRPGDEQNRSTDNFQTTRRVVTLSRRVPGVKRVGERASGDPTGLGNGFGGNQSWDRSHRA